MKKNKNSSALMRISELHYLYVCATMLDKAIAIIGRHLFTEEELVPINVHIADIMMALNAKSNELK
jgi:hypothetical protein